MFRKKFCQRRASRLQAMSKRTGIAKKNISAAKNMQGPQISILKGEEYRSALRKEFELMGLQKFSFSQSWLMRQRKTVAHYTACLMANSTIQTVKDHFGKVQNLKCPPNVYNPTKATVVVVVDLDKDHGGYKTVKDKFIPMTKEDTHMCNLFGQYIIHGHCEDKSPVHAVPLVYTSMDSIIDCPFQSPSAKQSFLRSAYNLFSDREGILTATMQMMDQLFEMGREMIGIDTKVIFTHGSDVDMEEMHDMVHCQHSELDAAIKSRVFSSRMAQNK